MGFSWRGMALVMAVGVAGACTSASGADRVATLDPTACEIDPHEEYDMPMPDVGWWKADPASWVLADAVRVMEPDDVDLTAEEREAVDAWKRSGRSVTPFVVDEVQGEVLRGEPVGRFIAEPNLAAGLVRHTGRGQQVLIGTGDSMFGHQAIAFVDGGRIEFLGWCMEHWRGPHVDRVVEQLQMEPPDLSLRVTPQELLLTLIADPGGPLGAAVEQVIHPAEDGALGGPRSVQPPRRSRRDRPIPLRRRPAPDPQRRDLDHRPVRVRRRPRRGPVSPPRAGMGAVHRVGSHPDEPA